MNAPYSINANAGAQHPVFPGAVSGAALARSTPAGLGVLMLDTQFPRLPGDIGHPQTWAEGSHFVVLPGLWPRRVVQSAAAMRAAAVLPPVLAAALALERQGLAAITTSCGFLVLAQPLLQARLRIPFVSSALLWLPRLLSQHARVGVLTISAKNLQPAHLLAAGVPRARLGDVVIQGVAPESVFVQAILGNRPTLDWLQAGRELLDAALALQARAPDLRAVVLECTNMPPLQTALQSLSAANGWRFYSLLDWPDLLPFRRPPGAALGVAR